jgi:hypothetical protein
LTGANIVMVALKNSSTLTKADAKSSAKKHGLAFVEGSDEAVGEEGAAGIIFSCWIKELKK